MENIEYHNPDRIDPLVLDRYIYVIVESGSLTFKILDSFYEEPDARARQRTLQEKVKDDPHRPEYDVYQSRLYK